MYGAIIGDIAGSRFELFNIKTKEFELMTPHCSFTDDSVMTIAVGDAIMRWQEEDGQDYRKLQEYAVDSMQTIGRRYPHCGYGGRFYNWMFSDKPKSYDSYGNGAAMRVSAAGLLAETFEEAKKIAYAVTAVTHNHPEGLKGAEATAVAIFLAREGMTKDDIKIHMTENYYEIDFTLDEIRPFYCFNESCQGTVPQALEAFFEAENYEDALRNAISIGGDSDTLAAIAGAVAGAYYGVPESLKKQAYVYLSDELREIAAKFERLRTGDTR
jgi:ADP-ribosylglycohydrolase